jgi:putative protease
MSAIKPELLAPAGSFMAAYHAYAAGADAVYVGLRRFSARGSAQNFNPIELAKLKALALAQNKKVYIALNTVIREEETDDLAASLADCERIGVDGVIVQDVGVLAIIRDHFPTLAVHASTQMAVGNAPGIREAARLGIRRIVLPREIPFETVKAFLGQFPDIEFEVFIHGALCYSYSGLCLASGLMGGGSGNRGACAQVCRLRFVHPGGEGHLLSCRDLFTALEVRRLSEAGIDSLKIEGRLKPASYVYHTVRLYRFVLDHERPEDEPEYADLLAHGGFVFTRERTKGRLFGGPDDQIITSRYERSVGYPVGRVERTTPSSFSFTARAAVAVGDVLQFYLNEQERVPFKLPVRNVMVDGRSTLRAERGIFVTVTSDRIPAPGQEISKVYARDLEVKGVRHKNFTSSIKKMPVRITLTGGASGLMHFETTTDGCHLSFSHRCIFEKGASRFTLGTRITQLFAAVEDPIHHFEVAEIRTSEPSPSPERTVGNRQLRMIVDAFVRHAAQAETARRERQCEIIREANRAACAGRVYPVIDTIRPFIHTRANLNPPVPPRALVPFFLGGSADADSLARTGDAVFVPLKPVVSDHETGYFGALDRFLGNNPGLTMYIGVNNLHHLAIVREWENYPHVYSFIDFFFYLANAAAVRFVLTRLSKVAFGYYWIEGGEEDRIALQKETGFPLFGTGATFTPPYFYHAGNFSRESQGLYSKERGNDETYPFRHDRFQFEAVSKNGFTYIFPAG